MTAYPLQRSLALLATLALTAAPQTLADVNHAADDEFAAAAAVLAPKFDPERDAITIEKLVAQREAAAKASSTQTKAGKTTTDATTATKTTALAQNAVIPLATGTGPDARGTWSPIIAWTPHIPVTASVLPNGKLLTFASNQRTTFPSGPEFTYAAVWDPATGQFTEVNNTRHDMFCGGTALLPDGRLVVNGGRATTRLSSIFDWRANQWNALPNMNDPRWYNTSVALPDGGVFTVSGSGGSNTAELWNEATGWRRLSGIGWGAVTSQPGYINIWHPFLMLAPGGNLFHFGPTDQMNWVTTSGTGSLTPSGNNVPGTHYPKEGAWAMYNEGRILVAGGGANTTSGSDSTTGTSSTASYKVDLRGSTPVVSSLSPMALARQFHNPVVLPNGEVMVIGGNGGRKFSDSASVLTPEIWNPETETWRTTANHAVPRNYHSVALLLPDGRVWSGGGGLGGNAADHRDAEIFTPPMLYNASGTLASRPVISSMPSKVGVGTNFTVNATSGLSRFTMIRVSAATHSMNTDQRFLEASFTETSPGIYQINARRNANVLLPGYWMLFGLDSSGVHSVSRIFQVDPVFSVVLASPGNQTGYVGEAATVALAANAPAGASLAFSATGLPAGLSIHPSTGAITGTPSVVGTFNITVSATDTITTASQSFTWTLAPASRSHKFASFPSATGISLNGNAAVASSRLRLTPATANQNGSAWLTQPFPVRGNTSFSSRWVFRQSGAADGGDGFTFVVQGNSATALGTGGGSLGYGGMAFSLAIEFDASTGTNDPNANHVAVLTNGAVTTHLATHTPSFDLEDGTDHTAWVEYDGTTNTLRVYLSQTVTQTRPGTPVISLNSVDLAALVGQQAWFGFTAATGGTVNAHEILSWDMDMDANKLPSLSTPPVILNPGPLTSVTGTPVSRQISASDPENDPLTFSASNLPPGLSISPGGLISGTPTALGSRNVTVSTSDGGTPAVSVTFPWTVNAPFELAPLAGGAVGTGAAGSFSVSFTGGSNVRFKWNFGDSSPETAFSISPTTSHSFASPGRYLVTLTATDDTGRTLTTSFYQGISAPPTSRMAAASTPITVERRSTGNHRVWVVNPDANTVAVLDAVTRAKLAEIPVAASPRTVAVAPDGRIWVAGAKGAAVSIIHPATLAVVQTLPMPRGSRPFGIAFDPAGTAAWLTLEATGRLRKLHPGTGALLAETPVGSDPRHLSVSHDGARVFVSRFITPLMPGEQTATIDTTGRGGEIVVINGITSTIDRTIVLRHSEAPDTSLSSRGIPNYLGAPVITPDGLSAWIPSKQDNIKRGILRDGQPLTHDSAVRPIASRVNLSTLAEDYPARIDFNDAGTPTAVCHDPAGIYTFVALEGSRAVAVVDTWNHVEITRFDAGRAPQGLILSADGKTLFVQNFMDRSVTVHDVSGILSGGVNSPPLLATLSTVASETLTAQVLTGKRHFYDTRDNRLALQEYISCASCHADAGQDGRVWDFTGFGEGLRNTITLHGQAEQGAYHWSGNFDEIQDFEGQIRDFAGGTGLIASGNPHPTLGTPNGGRSGDLDALAAYLDSLTETEASPARQDAQTLPPSAAAGREVFLSANCASCHSGPEFTNSAPGVFRDVGTRKPSSGTRLGSAFTGFDVPTLRGLWATAPYLHDGSAPTLTAAISAHSEVVLTNNQLADLQSYLLNIDEEIRTAPAILTEFVETFDGSVLDTSRWETGTPFGELFSPSDPLVTVAVQSGRLGVTPRANTSVEGYNGVVSRDLIDLRSSAVEARIDPSGGTSNTWLALVSGTRDFLVVGREGSVLWLEQTINGARDVTLYSYDSAAHLVWRIKHDAASDRILFQLSADGIAWITARSVARAIDIRAMRIELAGGSYLTESAPGTGWFDYVLLSRPPVAPAIASFTASPQEISAGSSSTLRWSVAPGSSPLTSLTVNGQSLLGSEEIVVSPVQTTTYTLSAASAAGSASATTTVVIRPTAAGLGYADWVAAFGATGSLASDADGDSYPEGLEYALGLDPGSGSTFRSTLPGSHPAISRGVRLERSVSSNGARRFDLVFTRPVTPLPDIGYGYWMEYSQDMENWAISANLNGAGASGIPDLLEIIVKPLGDGTEEVRAGFRYIPKFFVRLAVYLPGGVVRSAPFGWLNRNVHFGENLIAPPFARESLFGGNFTSSGPSLTDAAASWSVNQWQGHFAHITSGPAQGAMLRVSSNTTRALSFDGESAALLARLESGPAGTYTLRRSHTLGSLFGADNRDGLVSGPAASADLVELVNPNSSFTGYHFDGNWKSVTTPATDATAVMVPPTDALFLRRRAFQQSEVHFFGEVVLGKRVVPVRSGISLPGTWNPVETANIDTLGVNSFFTPSTTSVLNSNIYLEIGTGGGLYPHYLKTGAGWRYYENDSTPAGSAAFPAAQSWLFIRSGPELLWSRDPAFNYPD
ncbi:MAG: putative Ig domain-containing protein [Luteolibacter sp.]